MPANPDQTDSDGDGIGDVCDDIVFPCPSDISGDDSVNVTDLLALLAAWGTCIF